jgi:hypothetical protein
MAKQPAKPDTTSATKTPKHRSPNYPAIGLEKALERAKIVYDNAKLHAVPVGVAHDKWGLKALSANGDQSVAALKAFGLLEVEGSGEKRQVRVSDMARRIILESPERSELIKQAALKPKVHADLWAKYGEGGLPSNDVLRSYLVFDLKFNESYVDWFIDEFRETLAFAEIGDDGTIQDQTGYDPAKSLGIMPEPRMPASFGATPPPAAASAYKDFHLYLPNNQQGVLRVPSVISQQDYDLLRTQIDHSLSVLQAISGLPSATEGSKGEGKQKRRG